MACKCEYVFSNEYFREHAVKWLVEALKYKPEGPGFPVLMKSFNFFNFPKPSKPH
jgi:hypothetical protein